MNKKLFALVTLILLVAMPGVVAADITQGTAITAGQTIAGVTIPDGSPLIGQTPTEIRGNVFWIGDQAYGVVGGALYQADGTRIAGNSAAPPQVSIHFPARTATTPPTTTTTPTTTTGTSATPTVTHVGFFNDDGESKARTLIDDGTTVRIFGQSIQDAANIPPGTTPVITFNKGTPLEQVDWAAVPNINAVAAGSASVTATIEGQAVTIQGVSGTLGEQGSTYTASTADTDTTYRYIQAGNAQPTLVTQQTATGTPGQAGFTVTSTERENTYDTQGNLQSTTEITGRTTQVTVGTELKTYSAITENGLTTFYSDSTIDQGVVTDLGSEVTGLTDIPATIGAVDFDRTFQAHQAGQGAVTTGSYSGYNIIFLSGDQSVLYRRDATTGLHNSIYREDMGGGQFRLLRREETLAVGVPGGTRAETTTTPFENNLPQPDEATTSIIYKNQQGQEVTSFSIVGDEATITSEVYGEISLTRTEFNSYRRFLGVTEVGDSLKTAEILAYTASKLQGGTYNPDTNTFTHGGDSVAYDRVLSYATFNDEGQPTQIVSFSDDIVQLGHLQIQLPSRGQINFERGLIVFSDYRATATDSNGFVTGIEGRGENVQFLLSDIQYGSGESSTDGFTLRYGTREYTYNRDDRGRSTFSIPSSDFDALPSTIKDFGANAVRFIDGEVWINERAVGWQKAKERFPNLESQIEEIEGRNEDALEAADGELDNIEESREEANRRTAEERAQQTREASQLPSAVRAFFTFLGQYKPYDEVSNLLIGEEHMSEWRTTVDQFFYNEVLGGTDYWTSEICRNEFDVVGDSVALLELPGGIFQFIGTIQAERSEPVPMLCNATGQCPKGTCRAADNLCVQGNTIIQEHFYKITYGVRAPDDDALTPQIDEEGAVSFNIVVSGPEKTSSLFTGFINLNNGDSKRDVIVKYSPTLYNQVCLIFGKKAVNRNGDDIDKICQPIAQSGGSFDNFVNTGQPGGGGGPTFCAECW